MVRTNMSKRRVRFRSFVGPGAIWKPFSVAIMSRQMKDEEKIMPPDTHKLVCEYCYLNWEEEERAKKNMIHDPQVSGYDSD